MSNYVVKLEQNLKTNASYVQTAAWCDYYVTPGSSTVHHNVTDGAYNSLVRRRKGMKPAPYERVDIKQHWHRTCVTALYLRPKELYLVNLPFVSPIFPSLNWDIHTLHNTTPAST